jgi:hypothetical protein
VMDHEFGVEMVMPVAFGRERALRDNRFRVVML